MQPKRSIIVCLVPMLTAVLLTSAVMAKPPEKIAEIEGITEYRLDNGLQVLLFPDLSKPTVTVNLTIFVGSRHEGYGEAGMAHLLEHMLFKGTPTHPEIDKDMQQRGARFNGTTWTDRTNYYETLPASDENLEYAIALEADRMVNSFIRGEDLASEMTVVRNEFEQGENSPSRILSQRIQAAAFEWHNYGKSTIGNRSDIERVPIPKLRSFYRRHYQPDNAMLIVAGKFDQEKALQYIEKYFGAIPRPEREIDRTYTEEPPQDGERTVVLRRVGEVGIVGAAYHIPASPHPDFAAVRVLSYILAMEPSGRLYTALVETKKAASVSGYAFAFHDPGLMIMQAEVRKDGSLEEVRKLLISEIEKIGEDGVQADEVERAKRQILKAREDELADSRRLAVSLSDWAAQGDWRLYFLYRDRIEGVTVDDVQRVARDYLRRNNRTVGLFIPTDEPQKVSVPATPDVQQMVRNYEGRQSIVAGEFFDPTPENIEDHTIRDTIGEGISLAMLPKKTRGEQVVLSLTLRYGDAENLQGLETACGFLPALMTRGTKKLSHQQLQDELDKNQSTLTGSGSLGAASFSLRTRRANLPVVLDLLRQVLREPALPEDEFEVMRREQLAELEAMSADPQNLAITRLRRTVAPYPHESVRYIPSPEEEMERFRAVTLDEVRTLYEQYLGAHAGELAIVGDFDPQQITSTLEEFFTGWNSRQSYKHVPRVAFTDVPGGQQTINTPGKANAAYFAGYVFPMDDSDPDYPKLLIGNFILGGSSLASRLGDRVRQQEGLSYGVFSAIRAETMDERASLTIGAISNPENVPRVVEVIREELDKLMKEGVTEQEVNRAVQGYLQQQTLSRSNDRSLVAILRQTAYADRTMQFYADQERAISKLTPEQILAALDKHIQLSRLVVVTAGDLK